MSDDVPKDNPLSVLERILASVATLITIAAGLPGVIRLLKGNVGLTTMVLLISGIIILWLGCLYVYGRKVISGKSLGLEVGCLKMPFSGQIRCPVLGTGKIVYNVCGHWI